MDPVIIIGIIVLFIFCFIALIAAIVAGFFAYQIYNEDGETLQSSTTSASTNTQQPNEVRVPTTRTPITQPPVSTPITSPGTPEPTPTVPTPPVTTPEPEPEPCGYTNKPVIDIKQGDLTALIGLTNGRKLTYDNAPFDFIKIRNYNVKKYTLDLTTDNALYDCKTFNTDDPKKLIVLKAFNDEDYTYTFENGAIYIENSSGKHKTRNIR